MAEGGRDHESAVNKVVSLHDAAAIVKDGDTVALSGFACTRNAIAFSHELIRQGRKNLTLSACVFGMDADLLVGAGAVSRLIYGGGSLDRYGPIQCVNRAYEEKKLVAEYYSSLGVTFRYLAGALGIPVWVALPFAPDWRWMLGREDSPWYPTMRLFRQSDFGNWTDVFTRMAEALEQKKKQASTANVPIAARPNPTKAGRRQTESRPRKSWWQFWK